jgi:hypothetical protein
MVAYVLNPSTQEAEAGRSWVQGQPELHSDTLSHKQNKNDKRNEVSQVRSIPLSAESGEQIFSLLFKTDKIYSNE